MNMEQIRKKLATEEYDFLRKEKALGDKIILLTLGGLNQLNISYKKL